MTTVPEEFRDAPGGIDMSPQGVEKPPIDMDQGIGPKAPLAPETVSRRAAVVKYLKPESEHTYGDLYQAINTGKEEGLRISAASDQDYARQKDNEKLIRDLTTQGPMSPERQKAIWDATQQNKKLTDPTSVFENQFAQKYMDTLYQKDISQTTGGWFDSVVSQVPEEAKAIKEVATGIVGRRQYLMTQMENLEAELKQQGTTGKVFDVVKGMLLPGYTQWNLTHNVSGLNVGEMSPAQGKQIEAERLHLLGLSDDEFKDQVDTIVNNLRHGYLGGNPELALEWVNRMLNYPSTDAAADNMSGILDIVFPIAGSKMARMATKGKSAILVKELEKASQAAEVKESAKSAIKNLPSVDKNTDMYKAFVDDGSLEVHEVKASVADAVGDTGEAAVQKATSRVAARISGTADPAKQTRQELITAFKADTDKIKTNTGGASRDLMLRVEEQMTSSYTKLINLMENDQRVNRTTGVMALEDASRVIKDDMIARSKYRGSENSIMDIKNIAFDSNTNNYSADIIFGRHTGELFRTQDEAKNFQKLYGLTGATPERSGNGFYLRYSKPVNETDDLFRTFLMQTAENVPESGWHSGITNWIRSGSDVLSKAHNMNRLIASTAPSNMLKLMKENSLAIKEANSRVRGGGWISAINNRGKWKQFDAAVKHSQGAIDPETRQQGYFFKTVGELYDHFNRFYGRDPDHIETEAYFQIATNTQQLQALKNTQMYSSLHRMGAEEFTISTIGADGTKQKTNPFVGIPLKEMPKGVDDAAVVFGTHLGNEEVYRNVGSLAKLTEDFNQGRVRGIEVAHPHTDPFKGYGEKIGNARVRYVFTRDVESKPLSLNQIPQRGGLPLAYEYDHSIAQARVRTEAIGNSVRHWFEGRNHIMPMLNRAEGRDLAKQIDTVRQLLQSGSEKEAAAYAGKHTPIPWDTLKGWFYGKNAMLSLDHPIELVPRYQINNMPQYLHDMHPNTIMDGTRRSAVKNEYLKLTEHDPYDLYTSNNLGSAENPLWSYKPAEIADPTQVLNRSISKLISSRYMDDYKIFSVEHWIERAIGLKALSGDPKEIRHSLFYNFVKPNYAPGIDAKIISQLNAERYAIKSFIGTPSQIDTQLHSIAQNLADTIYTKLGPATPYTGVFATIRHPSTFKLLPPWLIEHATDPFTFARSMSFHATMGLFNPAQMLVQSATFANIAALGGRDAIPGTLGHLLHQWSRVNENPAILNFLDKVASNVGAYKPGDFLEARKALISTGFHNVGEEQMLYRLGANPKTIQTTLGEFLDAGTVFFKETEGAVRMGAWYTAWHEMRKVKPTGAFTREDISRVLDRADLMAGNMTRASRSALQAGPGSWATQYVGYTLRLAEQMMGKRLTPQEKGRLIAVYGALFGAPVAENLAGLPFGEIIRKQELENGYDPNKGGISSWVNEGVLGKLMNALSGDYYNIGSRLGTQGIQPLADIWAGDKPTWDIITGAPGEILKNAWSSSDGLRAAMMSLVTGGPNTAKFEDVLAMAKNISTVNKVSQFIMARKLGEWVQRNEGTLAKDVTNTQAAIMASTGLLRTDMADTRYMFQTLKDEKQLEKWVENHFRTMIHRWNRAVHDNNPTERDDWYGKSQALLDLWGYPQEKRAHLLSDAMKDQSTVDRAAYQYYLDRVNEQRKQKAMETYSTRKQ